MKRCVATLMLFLFVVSPISANRGKLLFMVLEGPVGAMAKLISGVDEVSAEVTSLREGLIRKDLKTAFRNLRHPAHMTSDSLMARLNSLPVRDNDRATHRNLIDFLNGDGPVPYEDVARNLDALRYFAVHYGNSKRGLFFPCPECGATDDKPLRMILNSEIVDIAKIHVPTERVQLENLLNSELARREFPILGSEEMAGIPLEYKQVWALLFQVSNYGQGHFKTIAQAILGGLKAIGISSKDLLYSRYSTRLYRLLFVEEFSSEEMEIWTDIINRVFDRQPPSDIPYERYKPMNGYAAYAEKYHGSQMGMAFHGTLDDSFISDDIKRQLDWRFFNGTVDDYVASIVGDRRPDFKELFDSSTVEAVTNAGTLMRRDMERTEDKARRNLLATIAFTEGLFHDSNVQSSPLEMPETPLKGMKISRAE